VRLDVILRPLAATLAIAGLALAGLVAASPALAAGSTDIRINEIDSDGSPDWVELMNIGTAPVDVAGYVLTGLLNAGTQTLPAGTTIAAGAVLEVDLSFGLKKGDTVSLFAADGTTLVDSYSWGDYHVSTWGRVPDGTGDFVALSAASPGVLNATTEGGGSGEPADDTGWEGVRVNEVTSANDDPTHDAFELVNTGDAAVDISGWLQTDSGHTPQPLTAGSPTSIPAHGTVVVLSNQGLSSDGDAVRVYRADGTTLVDSVTWGLNDAEPGSWSRCPDATGDWVHTATASFGASNATACAGTIIPTSGDDGSGSDVPCQTEAPSGTGAALADGAAWPGSASWTTSDAECAFVTSLSGQDVSGRVFDQSDAGVLWAAKNKSHVYRLVRSGGLWVPDTANDWAAGKDLVFPGGTGQPDSEGITVGPDGFLYVTTERDNTASSVTRDTVLRFDPAASGTTLQPTTMWDLTADFTGDGTLAATGADANLGFEGITWVPDSYLTANGFVDQSTGAAYDPADYPGHGTGLYFLALEKNGDLYAYALHGDGTSHRVAQVDTGMPAIAEVQWDADLQRIWAVTDNTSSGSTELLGMSGTGALIVDAVYDRPAGLPNDNLEGFAVAPDSTCGDGVKEVVRSDDGNNDGHSLWSGTIDCGLALAAQGPGTTALRVSTTSATAGTVLQVTGERLTPGVEYTLTLHSDPVVVGTAVAGTNGALGIAFTVPAGTPAGAHTLVLTANGSILASAPVAIAAQLAATGVEPGSLAAVGVAMLLLGIGALSARALRRRRAA